MIQQSIFESNHLVRMNDPQTSVDAATKVDTFRARHEAKIYSVLWHGAGKTYREVASETYLEPVAVGRRLKGMEEKGLIKRHGTRDGMTTWVRV